MSSNTLRVLLIAGLVLVAFTAVTAAFAQGTTTNSAGAAAAVTTTATPQTLPTTGGAATPTSTATIVLLALGATAGLGGLLLRGLRQPR